MGPEQTIPNLRGMGIGAWEGEQKGKLGRIGVALPKKKVGLRVFCKAIQYSEHFGATLGKDLRI